MTEIASEAAVHPVGVVILGRKRPGFDQEWNKLICGRSIAALEQMGFATAGADAPVVDEATTVAKLEQLERGGCSALVMLQPSMGHGQLALTIAQRWTGPVVLWATPERPGDGKVSSCSLVGQHLWGSSLRQAGHAFELVYGDPDDAQLRTDLLRAIAVARAAGALKHAKLGVIGTHAPGFIDLAAEPFLMQRTFGIQLHPLSLPQYIDRVYALKEDAVREDVESVLAMKLPMNEIGIDDLQMNSRCYLAMLELIEEECLNGIAIQCWPELPNVLGQWPYLAVSRLTTAGRAVSIEGDVDGCAGSLVNCLLGIGPGFLTDWLEHDRNTIFFWHPGMAPINMCNAAGSEGGPSLAKHFNIVKPLVVDGRIREGEAVTVSRLWRCDGEYFMTAFQGRTVAPKRKLTGSTVLVELTDEEMTRGGTVPERFDRLVHAGMPHHVLLSFGTHAETFRRLARATGVKWQG